jgi:DnaJ-class molecular chaperone
MTTCPECEGLGYHNIQPDASWINDDSYCRVTCSYCNGTGRIPEAPTHLEYVGEYAHELAEVDDDEWF